MVQSDITDVEEETNKRKRQDDDIMFYDAFDIFSYHEPYISYEIEADIIIIKSEPKIDAKSIRFQRIFCNQQPPKFNYIDIFTFLVDMLPDYRNKGKFLTCANIPSYIPFSSSLKFILTLTENKFDHRRYMPLSLSNIDNPQLAKLVSFVFPTLQLAAPQPLTRTDVDLFLANSLALKQSSKMVPLYKNQYTNLLLKGTFSDIKDLQSAPVNMPLILHSEKDLDDFFNERHAWWSDKTPESLFFSNKANIVLCRETTLSPIITHAMHVFQTRDKDFPPHTKIGVWSTTPYLSSDFLENVPCVTGNLEGVVLQVVAGAQFMGVGEIKKMVEWAEAPDRLLYLVGNCGGAPSMNLLYGKMACVEKEINGHVSKIVSKCTNLFDWMFDSGIPYTRMYPPYEKTAVLTKHFLRKVVHEGLSVDVAERNKKITCVKAPHVFNQFNIVTHEALFKDKDILGARGNVVLFSTRRVNHRQKMVDFAVGDIVFDQLNECFCKIKQIYMKGNCITTDLETYPPEVYSYIAEDDLGTPRNLKTNPVYAKTNPIHVQCNKQTPYCIRGQTVVLIINDKSLNLKDAQFALDISDCELLIISKDFNSSIIII